MIRKLQFGTLLYLANTGYNGYTFLYNLRLTLFKPTFLFLLGGDRGRGGRGRGRGRRGRGRSRTFLRVSVFKYMFIKQPMHDKSLLLNSVHTSTLLVHNEVNYHVFILRIIL
jgi:hypothetical protein